MNEKSKLWTARFIGISLINVLLFFGYQLQLSTLPLYLYSLSGTDSIVGISTALTTAAAIIVRPLSGYALDRIGRKKILLIGTLLMIGSFYLYSVFNTIIIILIVRFISGLGWGISTTSSNTIVTDVIPKERFGEGMGFFSLSQSLSLALAPLTGLALYSSKNFTRVSFAGVGLIGVAVLISIFLPVSKAHNKIKKFRPYEKSAIKPAIVMVFVGFGVSTTFSYAILYGKSMGFQNVGLFFTLYAIMLFITRPLIGKLLDKFGFHSVMIPGFVGLIVSLLILCFSNSEPGFLLSALLQGICYGALQTSIQAMAVLYAPDNRKGAANATYFTGFDLGIGLGGLIAGIIASYLGYNSMFGLMSVTVFAGFILYVFLFRDSRSEKKLNFM